MGAGEYDARRMEGVRTKATSAQVGTIFIENRPLILRALDLENDFYSGIWGVLQSHTSTTLTQKIRGTGWNCLFMAGEVKTTGFGMLVPKSIRRALKKIFAKVRLPHFNCLEVTSINQNRFFGLPCITVRAHSRHISRALSWNLPRRVQR